MNGRREALLLVMDDHKLLVNKIQPLLVNLNIPGSLSLEAHRLMELMDLEIKDLEDPSEFQLRDALSQLVSIAVQFKIILENSLVPGELVEEAAIVLSACNYLDKKWVRK
jgi:hypothetical protein